MEVGYTAGGATDVAARTVAEALGKRWGQSVIVENRPGAGGNIAAVHAARSKPDGYTLLMIAPAHAINVSLYANAGYDATGDFEAIGRISYITNLIVVNPAFPARSTKELIALAKAKPGDIQFASGGIGISEHLSAELFQYSTGIKLSHIPYRGTAAAVPDLLSGQVMLTFGNLPALLPYLKSGALRALSVNSAKRSPLLPDVPTTAEAADLPGYDVSVWLGLVAPAGTPKDVVAKINRDLALVLQDPSVRARLEGLGMDIAFTSPDAFRDLIASEKVRYAKVIQAANIKVE